MLDDDDSGDRKALIPFYRKVGRLSPWTVAEAVRTVHDKVGFAPPMVQWFEGELRPWLYDLVNSQEAAQSPIGVAPYLKQQLEHSSSPFSWNSLTTLWPSIQAVLWTTIFGRLIGNR